MNRDKYNRKVTLHCTNCGNTQFEYDDSVDFGNQIIKCSSCNGEYSKNELMRKNKKVIDSNIEDVKKEVIKDIKKDLGKIFNK